MANRRSDGEALVVFTTRLREQFQVPEDQLVVPETLARYGLSEIVNQLLGLEPPTPFDFLVNGEFLRTSLRGYLDANKLTAEKALTLEYVVALGEPEPEEVEQVPDWVSGVAALQPEWFATTSYDGVLRLYHESQSKLSAKLCSVPLVGIAAWHSLEASHVAAASKDGSIKCCAIHHRDAQIGTTVTLDAPERKAMACVAMSKDGSLLAGGGWANEVYVWNADMFDQLPTSGLKRKSPEEASAGPPKFVFQGHSQAVTCLRFGDHARLPFTLISGSWDCTLRAWDLAAASCVSNWSVGRAVTSVSTSPSSSPQFATSHEDGHISLWDVRAPPHASIAGAYTLDSSSGLPLLSASAPHRRLSTEVAWSPYNEHRIASVGHDGSLCILDPRSPKMPLQAIAIGNPYPCPTKVLCVAWLADDRLAMGTADGKVLRVSTGANAPAGQASVKV